MGRLILTGLTKTKNHEFTLDYVLDLNIERCFAKCKCGFSEEIPHYYNYAGVKELEVIWSLHIISRNGRKSGPSS